VDRGRRQAQRRRRRLAPADESARRMGETREYHRNRRARADADWAAGPSWRTTIRPAALYCGDYYALKMRLVGTVWTFLLGLAKKPPRKKWPSDDPQALCVFV